MTLAPVPAPSVPAPRVRRPRLRAPAYEPDPVPPGALPPPPVRWPPAGPPPGLPPLDGTGVVLAPDATGPGSPGRDDASRGGASDAVRAASGVRAGPAATDTAPRRADEPPDADAVRLRATALVRTMVEVLAGRRPPAHLAGPARPEVVRYLAAGRCTDTSVRAGAPGGAGPARTGVVTGPRRVHVFRPGPDAAEIVAVCRIGTRFRALTVRMDREAGAWCATAVRLL